MTDAAGWLVELTHSWPILQATKPTEISSAPLPIVVGSQAIRIGLDGQGSRHLMIPIVGPDEPKADESDGSLVLRIRSYTFGGHPSRYVDVVCRRTDLFDLFDEVLVDVLSGVAGENEGVAGAAVRVVNRWRALLALRPARLLTLKDQLALLGELHVLRMSAVSNGTDIQSWRGPLREPHDIVLPGCALEVKAIGTTSTTIEIHGVRQLEPPGLPLALVIVCLSESDTGESLPEVVDQLLDHVHDRAEALRRLAAVGYSLADADEYNQKFTIDFVDFVIVSGETPRIVPAGFVGGSVPSGVSRVNYLIELGTLEPYFVRGETALLEWISGAGT